MSAFHWKLLGGAVVAALGVFAFRAVATKTTLTFYEPVVIGPAKNPPTVLDLDAISSATENP